MQETTFAALETMFLALGDKTRLGLLALMADGPVAVGFLADRLKESQPKVSRHLAYLRNADMVTATRDGKWIYYGIKYPNDTAQQRILESVMSLIAVVEVDGKEVYLVETDPSPEPPNHIYADAYEDIVDTETDSSGAVQEYSGEESTDKETLDIFLL